MEIFNFYKFPCSFLQTFLFNILGIISWDYKILPQLIKGKGSLLGPFLCGSLLSHLSKVSAEYMVSGFIRNMPRGEAV